MLIKSKVSFCLIAIFIICFFLVKMSMAIDLAPKVQQQPKIRGLILNDEEIQWVVKEADRLLNMPNTEIMFSGVSGPIDHLALQGNKMIPFLNDFLEHEKPRHRRFARAVLLRIGTDECLSIVCEQFWKIYKKAYNIENITARHVTFHNFSSQGIEIYGEARDIFIELIKTNSKCFDEICLKVMNDNNGIGVMAARYMWKKNGKEYREKFYRFTKSDEKGETLFTFLDEMVKIFENNEEKDYQEMGIFKKDFNPKVIDLVNKIDVSEEIFDRAIRYLSLADVDCFAENWLRIYKEHLSKSNPSAWSVWSDKERIIRFGVSNNEKAQQKIEKLKDIIPEEDYMNFKNSVKELSESGKKQKKEDKERKEIEKKWWEDMKKKVKEMRK